MERKEKESLFPDTENEKPCLRVRYKVRGTKTGKIWPQAPLNQIKI